MLRSVALTLRHALHRMPRCTPLRSTLHRTRCSWINVICGQLRRCREPHMRCRSVLHPRHCSALHLLLHRIAALALPRDAVPLPRRVSRAHTTRPARRVARSSRGPAPLRRSHCLAMGHRSDPRSCCVFLGFSSQSSQRSLTRGGRPNAPPSCNLRVSRAPHLHVSALLNH